MSAYSSVIVTNGWYENDRQKHQIARLTEEGKRRGVSFAEWKNNVPVLTGDVFRADFVLFLDKDFALAEKIEASGIPVFNASESLTAADDKARTATLLQSVGISVPKTVVAPKCYHAAEDDAYLTEVFRLFRGKPVIVKERESSLGMGVYRAETFEQLKETVQKIGVKPHLFQEEVTESLGKSVRAYVTGGRIVGAMKLINGKDFRSNAELGGIAEAYELTEAERETVLKTAERLKLTFAGIDLFCTASPSVIEVNSNAYFEAFENVTKKNAAGAVVDAVLEAYLTKYKG